MVVCQSLFAIKNFSATLQASFKSKPNFLITAIIPLKAVVVSVKAPSATTLESLKILLTFSNSTPADEILKAVSSNSSLAIPNSCDITLISSHKPVSSISETPATVFILDSPASKSAKALTASFAKVISVFIQKPAKKATHKALTDHLT